MLKYADFERQPCTCPECVQAGVSEHIQIRDFHTGKWLHGYALKRWYAARAKALTEMAELRRTWPRKIK